MTFAIVGRGEDGQLGVAASSCVLGVGGRCPAVGPGLAAISSQAYGNPHLAGDVIERLRGGARLRDAVEAALAGDPAREWRQLAAVGADGKVVVHTGAETDPWAGHRAGATCAAAGNLLTGPEVVEGMVEAFAGPGELTERLVRALEAGQAAGGDRRGRQSAALLVHGPEPPAYVDLRVDDHPEPVAELRRLWELMAPDARERAWHSASTRELEPVDALRARQAQVRARLDERRT